MEFVSFKIAKKLKEKGFKEQCVAYYTKDSNFYYNTSYGSSDVENVFKSFNSRPNHICGKRIDAPIISQVLKWLRDEKDIFIEITVDVNDKFNYYFGIYKKGNDTWEYIGQNDTYDYFEMYEEAAMVGIEWVLDNILL